MRSWLSAIAFEVCLSAFTWAEVPTTQATEAPVNSFVKRAGNQLMLDGKPFRFSGVNIYWMCLDSHDGKLGYPSHFRIDDALDTAREMGENVVRIETFGESTGNAFSIEPALGQFNDEAFKVRDYILKAARDRGIRIIAPFVDNYYYAQGGKHNFTDWRGITDPKKEYDASDPKIRAFYSDPRVIRDYEDYVAHILNHVNTLTGIAYKDDPMIFCWETGDEISYCSGEWRQRVGDYIKQLDGRHLLMDGKAIGDEYTYDPWKNLQSIDIESPHYHPEQWKDLATLFAEKKKVMIIGEFKYNGNVDLKHDLGLIESNPNIAGDLYWDLQPHADDHGFQNHNDDFTLHYPGDTPDMRQRAAMLRAHAYRMRGEPEPAPSIPAAPLITSAARVDGKCVIAWRGSAGADVYTVERGGSSDGPWKVVADRAINDTQTPWTEADAPAGDVWYRVKAFNLAGISGPYSEVAKIEAR